MTTYMGIKIVSNPLLTITAEDWSAVRSPARARRRERRRFRQNITYRVQPDPKVYMIQGVGHMHPEVVAELVRRANADAAVHGPTMHPLRDSQANALVKWDAP